MDWSSQQEDALKQVALWLKDRSAAARGRQVFRLFGYAGTGKTTLARHIAEGIDGKVAFAAYTGKAALVMRSKGCEGASTLHSLIYRPQSVEEEDPTFALNRESEAVDAQLIIVDECSMVDEELGRDLLSFGTKVLVLGDPAQLPPVSGGGFFTETEPDVMLTQVHRQAQDNPIVRLSMIVREGGILKLGTYGASRIIPRALIDQEQVLAADQVLVGMNKSRRSFNARIRTLKGAATTMPESGDKLVCLRNNKKKGLLNGGLWSVKAAAVSKRNLVTMRITPEEDLGGRTTKISVRPEFFSGDGAELPYELRRNTDEFDYGYALTVHKSQGSQWSRVVLFDESFAFKEHNRRWLYTGITRAADEITIVM